MYTYVNHAHVAAAAPINPGFLTVIFSGFPRVCALSIRTSGISVGTRVSYAPPGKPGKCRGLPAHPRTAGRYFNNILSLADKFKT